MDEDRSPEKKRCKAMIDAGVYDPDSEDGIDFCTTFCPYNYCVVFESPRQFKAKERKNFVQALRAHGVTVDDIALILGAGLRTVQRLLKKRREGKE